MSRKKVSQPSRPKVPSKLPGGVRLKCTLRGHSGIIGRIAWSPDGRLLASPSSDKTVRLWDVEKAVCLNVIDDSDGLRCATFNPQGGSLAFTTDGGIVKVLGLASGKILHTLSNRERLFRTVSFRPDGQFVACGGDSGQIGLWNPVTDLLRTINSRSDFTYDLAFDPTGRILASAHQGGKVTLWEAASRRLVRTLEVDDAAAYSVAFDPAGRWLVAGYNRGSVGVWNHQFGKLLHRLEGHTSAVDHVQVSPDGRLLASKSDDGTVRIIRCDTWETVAVLSLPKNKNNWWPGLSFHPHLPLLAAVGSDPKSGPDCVVHVWELDAALPLGKPFSTTVTYTTAKIVLVGDSGVGKTGLGWRMAHGSFKEHASTHGQQFWLLEQLHRTRTDGTQCEAILWDLAGQPDYRLIHALFLDDADLALVLFDPTRNDDPLRGVEFWLKQLGVGGKKEGCPAVLVAARADRGTARMTTSDIEAFCRKRGIGSYISTSASKGDGIEELIQRMDASILWDNKPATVTTESFKRVKDYVLALKENRRRRKTILTPAELRERLEKTDRKWKFTDAEMLTAVGHLANHGYVTKLKTSKAEERILLAPELLNNLAASFILEARRQPKGLGSLEEQRLLSGKYGFPELESVSNAERDVLLDSAAAMFLAHNICFRETDPLTSQAYLVFPELINLRRPSLDEESPLEDGVAYTVAGSVENVYASLVVLLGYTHTFTRTNQWKNQARYEVGDGMVCAFRQEGDREGELEFVLSYGINATPPTRTLFQSLFESFLARRNLTVRRYEPVDCSRGHQINRAVVRDQLAASSDFAFCAKCGERVSLPKADEPIQLTQQQARDMEVQRRAADQRSRFEQAVFRWKSYVTEEKIASPECFISYAWGNPKQEHWVEHSLATDLLKAGVAVVLDRWENKRIGASVPRFVERAGKSERVVVLGTPLYRTKYENNEPMRGYVVAAEGDLIGKRMIGTESAKEAVLPALLEGTEETAFPHLLQGRVYADFRDPEAYFKVVFDLILSLFRIPPQHRVAEELRDSLNDPRGR